MKLYGNPPNRAIRPIWVLNALDLDFEMIPVDIPNGEHLEPHFLAVNPFGKVPVLVDGDVTIAESAAIPFYLAECYGGERFIPADVKTRAQMHQWNFYLVTEIEQPLWRIALHTVIYHEHERIPAEIALAERDCRRMLAPLERHMDGRECIAGDSVTIADFNAAYTLGWAQEAGLLDDAPILRRYVARMYERPDAPPTLEEGLSALREGRVAGRRRGDPTTPLHAMA